MVAHAALAAQHAKRFAAGLPHILAGDFNFQPPSSCYELMTTGSLPADHVHQPPTAKGDDWSPLVSPPMVSAYVAAGVSEPEFTNLAVTKFNKPDEPPFCETLDYIFLSSGDWSAQYARPLPRKAEVLAKVSSYPTADEPSDHVAIYADLDIEPRRDAAAPAA